MKEFEKKQSTRRDFLTKAVLPSLIVVNTYHQ